MKITKTLMGTIAVGCMAALGGTVAHSQNKAMDTTFAKQAAAGGVAEVKLGQLAQEKAQSTTVKNFGKRMQEDHTKAGDQLKEVASKDNMNLPSSMDAKDRATYDRLSKLSGAEFDRAYAQDMVKDHEQDIAAFKKEATTGQNPDVKGFASQTLPTLEEHLNLAKSMEKSVDSKEASNAKPIQ